MVRGEVAGRKTWCACTLPVSPGTCSIPCGAIAGEQLELALKRINDEGAGFSS